MNFTELKDPRPTEGQKLQFLSDRVGKIGFFKDNCF